MKRSTVASILGCIICLFLALLVAAQNPTNPIPGKNNYKPIEAKDKTKPKGGQISASLDYERTGKCRSEADRKPEVVYLSLTAEQYANFQKDDDALAFVNNYKLFTCPVTAMKHLSRTETKSAVTKPHVVGDPVVAVVHDPDCGGYWYDVPY